jgi:DNA gyrase subunit A
MGLVAAGVMGIKLQGNDQVVGMELLPRPGEVFMLTDAGRAKRVETSQFPKQGRHGQGVVAWNIPGKENIIGVAVGKGTTRGTVFMKKLLPKTIRLDEAPLQGRSATRGSVIQEVKTGDQITSFTIPVETPRPTPKKKRGARA